MTFLGAANRGCRSACSSWPSPRRTRGGSAGCRPRRTRRGRAGRCCGLVPRNRSQMVQWRGRARLLGGRGRRCRMYGQRGCARSPPRRRLGKHSHEGTSLASRYHVWCLVGPSMIGQRFAVQPFAKHTALLGVPSSHFWNVSRGVRSAYPNSII